jgi:hypothetical protein
MMITEHQVHFQTGSRTKKELVTGAQPEATTGRIPRVAKIMALAIRFDQQIRSGVVKDQAELALLGHVARVRLTLIMNLNHLAPDIQEEILHLPLHQRGREKLMERDLRRIAAEADWGRQREMWRLCCGGVTRQPT